MNAAVEFRDASIRLGDHLAVANVSLAVPEGAFVGVIGPNGGGKSTLLKSILGLVVPSSGSVRVFGGAPESVAPNAVGYIPQFKTLDRRFPAKAIELVVTGMRSSWPWRIRPAEREKATAALEMAGAAPLAERAISHLSGGELQRVFLARALVREPRLILLDEPATGMDPEGRADLYEILEARRRATGATIVMVTHDWGVAYHHATRVLMLDRRAIAYGPPDEALSEASLREAFGHVGHAHAMTPGPPEEKKE